MGLKTRMFHVTMIYSQFGTRTCRTDDWSMVVEMNVFSCDGRVDRMI